MKTITLHRPGHFELTDTPEPSQPGPGQALVRVHRVGICGTDISGYLGKMPFFSYPRIPGHELGVTVEAVGSDVTDLYPGDNCSVEPYMNCGRCIGCRRGHGNCCVNMQVIGVHTDGGMRERILVPAHKLHKSRKLSTEQLALVETLAIGAHAVHRAQPAKGENVLVIGAGPIGLTVIEFARLNGSRIIVMDVNDDRLAFAKEHYLVDTINCSPDRLGTPQDPTPTLLQLTDNDLPTIVFDATGNPKSMMASLDYMAHSGKLCFVGITSSEWTFAGANFHKRETTLLGSRNALPNDFKRIIQLIEDGKIDTTPWITHRASASEMPGLFPKWIDPATRCLKAIVEF